MAEQNLGYSQEIFGYKRRAVSQSSLPSCTTRYQDVWSTCPISTGNTISPQHNRSMILDPRYRYPKYTWSKRIERLKLWIGTPNLQYSHHFMLRSDLETTMSVGPPSAAAESFLPLPRLWIRHKGSEAYWRQECNKLGEISYARRVRPKFHHRSTYSIFFAEHRVATLDATPVSHTHIHFWWLWSG